MHQVRHAFVTYRQEDPSAPGPSMADAARGMLHTPAMWTHGPYDKRRDQRQMQEHAAGMAAFSAHLHQQLGARAGAAGLMGGANTGGGGLVAAAAAAGAAAASYNLAAQQQPGTRAAPGSSVGLMRMPGLQRESQTLRGLTSDMGAGVAARMRAGAAEGKRESTTDPVEATIKSAGGSRKASAAALGSARVLLASGLGQPHHNNMMSSGGAGGGSSSGGAATEEDGEGGCSDDGGMEPPGSEANKGWGAGDWQAWGTDDEEEAAAAAAQEWREEEEEEEAEEEEEGEEWEADWFSSSAGEEEEEEGWEGEETDSD
jgi:hypothetical protein